MNLTELDDPQDLQEFAKLKTKEQMLQYLIGKFSPDGLECGINEMKIALKSYREKSKNKSLSLAKVYESAADEMVQTKVNFEPVQVENLYSKAINMLPVNTGDTERPCSHQVRLYTKRAQTRFDMKQYEDALSDIYLAIRFRNKDLVPTKRGSVLELLALQCLTELKLIDESDRKEIEEIRKQPQQQGAVLYDWISRYREKFSNKSNFSHNERLGSKVNREDYFRLEVDNRWRVCSDPKRGRFAIASEDIPTGSVLLVEKPYSAVVSEHALHKQCNYCLFRINPMQAYACEHCDEVIFCSFACFEEAYAVYHRYECGITGFLLQISTSSAHVFRILSEFGVENALRYDRDPIEFSLDDFLANESLRTKARLEWDSSERLALYQMSTSLVEHSDKYNTEMQAYHASRAYDLTRVLAVQNPELFQNENLEQNFTDLFKLCMSYIRRIVVNVFGHTEPCTEDCRRSNGNCEFLVASLINHSCDPNVSWEVSNGHIIFKSTRLIKKNEEINIAYFQRYNFSSRQECAEYYFFICQCNLCVDDVRDLTTFICPTCRAGPIVFTNYRAGCQNCQTELCKLDPYSSNARMGKELLRTLEKQYDVIECHRKLISGVFIRFGDLSNSPMATEEISLNTLKIVDSAKEYLLENMFRYSDTFENYLRDLTRIYLSYNRYDTAIELVKIVHGLIAGESSLLDLTNAEIETKLLKLNFWTEVCARYFAMLEEFNAKLGDTEILSITVSLFVRFAKLTNIVVEKLSKLDPNDCVDDGYHEHNETTLMVKLSEQKKATLLNIVDYAISF